MLANISSRFSRNRHFYAFPSIKGIRDTAAIKKCITSQKIKEKKI